MKSRLVPLIDSDATRGPIDRVSHEDGGFVGTVYQAAAHAQRRTLASTVRYAVLVLSGLVFAPLLYPGILELSQTTLLHGVVFGGCIVAMMFIAREVWVRKGPTSRAYRIAWCVESAVGTAGFLSLAWAGGDHGFIFWLLLLVQVLLIAMEDATTAFPRILFGVGPLAVAAAFALQGRWNLAVWAVVLCGCAQVMCIELQKIGRRLSDEVRERQALAQRLSELSKYDERARIARDLHDGLAAELTALSFRVDSLRRKSDGAYAADALAEVGTRVHESLDELRSVVWAMRAPEQAFDEVAEYLKRRCKELCGDGVSLRFEAVDSTAKAELLSGPVRLAVSRLVLEGVRNAVRHGAPTFVEVRISRDTELRVTVRDDGVGLTDTSEDALEGGLPNMRTRVKTLGGRLEIASDATGTRVSSVLPLVAS